eukprot:TRINITY_DN2706_c0_g1_i1.p1 TRINITY_DN2706_c0_g1~~TRINITY_DN2706_c0_g1_i1.p1  ORF type:complete len:404 (+),score=92.46 TRINITY_DN2706_c0_g1_i1:44-1255(+)
MANEAQAVSVQKKGEENVVLGFVRQFDEHDSDFFLRNFSSKTGGLPSWLIPEEIPTREQVKCEVCSKPLSFLLQLYAPLGDREDTYHRMIYVFVCKDGICHKNSSDPHQVFKVFRGQLKRKNPYYDEDISDSEEDDTPLEERKKKDMDLVKIAGTICEVCGLRGTKRCGGCGHVRYCEKDHQMLDWSTGHDRECKNMKSCPYAPSSTTPPPAPPSHYLFCPFRLPKRKLPQTFIEFKIETEDEDLEELKRREKEVEEKMSKMMNETKLLNKTPKEDEVDDEEETKKEKEKVDKYFMEFQKRIAINNDQVLRYYHGEGEREELWVATKGQAKESDINNCQNCGAKRRLEFQILSQLLYYLKVEAKDNNKDTLDWGTLVIYTCSRNCSPPSNTNYLTEFIWRQNF